MSEDIDPKTWLVRHALDRICARMSATAMQRAIAEACFAECPDEARTIVAALASGSLQRHRNQLREKLGMCDRQTDLRSHLRYLVICECAAILGERRRGDAQFSRRGLPRPL